LLAKAMQTVLFARGTEPLFFNGALGAWCSAALAGRGVRMKNKNLFGLVAIIVAPHMVLLSMLFGPRHIGYIVTATLSATLIWGVVLLLDGRKHRAGVIAGLVVVLAVQQAAYQVWKAKLPGCWWPLGQFGALQFLIAVGISQAAKQASGTGKFQDP
jgi:hypothetical protein